ncbi:DNA polymerase III subunit delta [Lacticaseibacillus pabuli]|uniref:DNA polymerase III subunit delta n=1 Tax=Lacticaseibacillus pabuli TaxID=3025672 RepID=A0ABY7WN62_9LACO|nr:DNA polymerase III subunit delta [Lacticaseibacillus sp. KACC 23028]WDF81629.1 DNA polymerase III subunit delta [Lacticaseibacillus sp. KACC 23028]
MQELSQVKQAIKKGQPSPVYLVLGTEAALINESRRVLRSIIPDDMLSMNYGRYDMQEAPLANATQELSEPPFFGDYREVVIENPEFLTGSGGATKQEEAMGELLAYVQDPSPSTVLVIIAPYPKLDARKKLVKAITKAATQIDASPMTEAKSKAVIRQQANAANVSIDEPALDALVSRTQAEYSAMVAAMPVLLLHAAQSKTITRDDVERLVPKQLTDSVFDLVDAILQRDAETALRIYHDLLLMKEEPLRLVSLLEGQFRLLIQLDVFKNRGYTQGAAATNLKVHPYRVKLAWRKLGGVNRADLDAAYMLLVNTEAAMKRGTLDKALGFELFILQYTGKQKRA